MTKYTSVGTTTGRSKPSEFASDIDTAIEATDKYSGATVGLSICNEGTYIRWVLWAAR